MKSNLSDFYRQLKRTTILALFIAGSVFLLTTVSLQYSEQKSGLERQAEFIERSVRGDTLSGSKALVYEVCRSLFSDESLVSLQVTKKGEAICSFERVEGSILAISASVPILFNPAEPPVADNLAGYVMVKVNSKRIILNSLISLGLLAVVMLLVNFTMRRLDRSMLNQVVTPLSIFSNAMVTDRRDIERIQKIERASNFTEISDLANAYVNLVGQLQIAEAMLVDKTKREVTVDVSRRVAHDIRSPLSALNAIIFAATELPENQKNLLKQVFNRINSIADDLLKPASFQEKQSGLSKLSDLKFILQNLIDEKRAEYERCNELTFGLRFNGDLSELPIKISAPDLSRIISNIVNNAAEAIAFKGFVSIEGSRDLNEVSVRITDRGPGIPATILEQLLIAPVTSKENGSGIGLYSASEILKSLGHDLIIESDGHGTVVTISLKFG